MKRVSLFVVTIFIFVLTIGCNNNATIDLDGDNYDLIQERGYIVVGMECQYAPFNWTVEESNASEEAVLIQNSNNYCDGFDVMIAQEIADGLNVELRIMAVDWLGLIPSLAENGQIDLIIAGMSPTAERAETVSFSSAYYSSTHVVLLRNDSVYKDATSISEFSGASIVAQESTIFDDLVDQMTGVTHENPLGDVPTIVTSIKSGIYDGTIVELPVAISVIASNPELTYVSFEEGNGFDVSYEDKAVAIALRQGEVTLLQEVNQILQGITIAERENLMVEAISRQP